MQKTKLEFKVAEVVSAYDNTYLDTQKNYLYSILVRTLNETNPQQIYCRPANIHIKQIPLVGELVFIFQGYGNESASDKIRTNWYYLTDLPVQSSLNHNSLSKSADVPKNEKSEALSAETGLSSIDINSTVPKSTANATPANSKLGSSFNERTDVPYLQPYEGDIILEGRFGNSIRLGSATKGGNYSVSQNSAWSGNPNDPIIILSNKRPSAPKTFSIERVNEDYSSLYLTSPGQEIKTIELSKELTKSNNFNGSQFIGSADKIVLQAKTGAVVLDASKRISMNANEILFGSEEATSPLIKGEVLEQVLKQLISAIRAGVIGPAGALSLPTPGAAALENAERLLNSMKSTKFKMDKE